MSKFKVILFDQETCEVVDDFVDEEYLILKMKHKVLLMKLVLVWLRVKKYFACEVNGKIKIQLITMVMDLTI